MEASRLTPELIEEYTEKGFWKRDLIDSFVTRAAAEAPSGKAVVDRGRIWTYGEIEDAVSRLAGALLGMGVQRGDVVSWQLPNWVEAILVHQATLRVGAVSNPIVAIYRETELSFILDQARSKVVFAPAEFRKFNYLEMYRGLQRDLPELKTVVAVGEGVPNEVTTFSSLLDHKPLAVPQQRDANDIALLMYTSGTTSAPKGAMHTHNTLNLENESIIELFRTTSDDVVFMPSPLTHVTGLLYGAQMPFQVRCPVVLFDVWDVDNAVALIDEHDCNWAVAATPFLHGLLSHCERYQRSLPFRIFGCGGADVPPELIRKGREVFGGYVGRVYGSTEAPTVSSNGPDDSAWKASETDGRTFGEVHVRIVDVNGKDSPPGENGEILTRGPELFLGYLDYDLDADAFTADGWFRTGDLGTVDDEGYLTITGRSKDIIIRGGENISAKEVEDIVFEHPKVREVAIIGMPDPILQERVCAVVVLTDGDSMDLNELISYVAGRGVAKQKWPEQLIVRDAMPRTTSGKIQKFKIREDLRSDSR